MYDCGYWRCGDSIPGMRLMTPLKTDGRIAVTVVIPVCNEEVNIERCLSRLERFSEIVLVDSGSTDRTCDIARARGVKVIDFRWNGIFPKKRNWYLMNETPSNPWVLFLDADEFVTDAFCDEVATAIKTTMHDGFWLGYTNYFLDVPLRHGLLQRKLALFRHGKGHYEKIEEQSWSQLDMEVHEHPIIKGSVGEISSPIDHRDYKGLAHFIARHRDYAIWEANRYLLLRDSPDAWAGLTKRQYFKYRNLTKWWYAAFYFIFTYFVQGGLLDGRAGFHYAAYKAWYFQTIRLLIREQQSKDQ